MQITTSDNKPRGPQPGDLGIFVPPWGPPNAKIVLVGEAPGVEEVVQKKPFVGSSGRLLRERLHKVGLNPDMCYMTNIIKQKIRDNNFDLLYLDGDDREQPSSILIEAQQALRDEIKRIKPNLVVPLGSEALRAVTGLKGIDKWRGSIIAHDGLKIVPTFHPARMLRSYAELPIFTADLARVQRQSFFPEVRTPQTRIDIRPSIQQVVQFLEDLLARPRPIAFDIETSRGEDVHVRCLGIADSALHALVIPFVSSSNSGFDPSKSIYLGTTSGEDLNNYWTEFEEETILILLKKVFLDPRIKKMAQNAQFDSQVLASDFGIDIRGFERDTMVDHFALYPELPKGLDFIASLHTEIPYYSDYEVSSDDATWIYNGNDCIVTWQAAIELKKDLTNRVTHPGFSSVLFVDNHLLPTQQTMTRMGQRGILIDTVKRDEIKTKYELEMLAYEEAFSTEARRLAGPDAIKNIGSPHQLKALFYDKMKMKTQYDHKTKRATTNSQAVKNLERLYPHAKILFDNLKAWSLRETLVTTFLNAKLKDGRWLASFNGVGTLGGRASSSSTFDGFGQNLQNIPNRTELGQPLRSMFVPDPGYVLIKGDLSQAQFRIAVWDAKIFRIMDKYLDSTFDVHRWVASLIYKVTEDKVSKQQRGVAKNGVYGGNFAMMAKRAAEVYEMPLDLATWVLVEYRKAIPEIPMWWLTVKKIIDTTRTIVSPHGQVRQFFERLEDTPYASIYRDAYAHICQAIEAFIIMRAAIVVEQILPQAPLLIQVHDELVLEAKEADLASVLPVLKRVMEYPVLFPGVAEPMIIPADLATGSNWRDVEKWKG